MPDDSMFDQALPKDALIALSFLADAVEEFSNTGSDSGGDLDFFVKVAGEGIKQASARDRLYDREAAIAYLRAAYSAIAEAWPNDQPTVEEMLKVTEAMLDQLAGREDA